MSLLCNNFYTFCRKHRYSEEEPSHQPLKKLVLTESENFTLISKKDESFNNLLIEEKTRAVELYKCPNWLGMLMQGNKDSSSGFTVNTIMKGGAVYGSGLIHEGDEIIKLNGYSLKNLYFQEVVQLIKGLQGSVSMVLRRHQ